MVEPIVIQSDQEYLNAFEEVEALIDAKPALGTPESDRLIVLSVAMEEWEAKTLGNLGMSRTSV